MMCSNWADFSNDELLFWLTGCAMLNLLLKCTVRVQKESEKLQDSMHAAHLRFRHRKSDALSALNALIAFDSQDSSQASAFCKSNFLHITALREMSALRQQLMRNITQTPRRRLHNNASSTLSAFVSETISQRSFALKPPGGTLSEALLRCIATGWADRIGKRMRSMTSLQTLASQVRFFMLGCAIMLWICSQLLPSFEMDLFCRVREIGPYGIRTAGQTVSCTYIQSHTFTKLHQSMLYTWE
jgi:hypothetical protein